jgi:hypothetical protein
MHFHVPRPIHGWRQFFNEVAVIVVGIVIAIGGEEIVMSWREHHQADKSLAAIKEEVAINLGHKRSRLETADCIDKRLSDVAAYVERADESRRPTWVGRPQTWAMQTGAVTAARSYGSLTVLPRDEQMTISDIYSASDQFADIEKDEQWAWAELRSITEDRDLSDSDKASLRQAIQRARYSAWLLRTVATQAIEAGKGMGVSPADGGAGSKSVCIPMDTPFEEAARLSSKTGIGEPR